MHKEPAVIVSSIVAIVAAVLVFLKSFGVDISDDQQASIRSLVAVVAPVVAGWVIRQFVFSPNTVDDVVEEAERGATTPAGTRATRLHGGN